MTAPVYIFPLVGYRAWQWDEIELKSLNGIRWQPGEPFTAQCITQGCSDAPQSGCTCGIYASKTLDHLRQIGHTQNRIHGEVRLWGKVVEHEEGWRAQCAYPKTLIVPLSMVPIGMSRVKAWLTRLAAYRCDIFVFGGDRTVPLWRRESAFDARGLDLLVQRCSAWYARRSEQRRLKRGDRVAVFGHGIAVVEHADSGRVQVVLGNKNVRNIERQEVVWDEQNTRWETAPCAGIGVTARRTTLSYVPNRGCHYVVKKP
jgi:hypothetical protein